MFAVIHNEEFLQYQLNQNQKAMPKLDNLKIIGYLNHLEMDDVFEWCNLNHFKNERSLSVGDIIAKKRSEKEWYYYLIQGSGFKLLFISVHPKELIKN